MIVPSRVLQQAAGTALRAPRLPAPSVCSQVRVAALTRACTNILTCLYTLACVHTYLHRRTRKNTKHSCHVTTPRAMRHWRCRRMWGAPPDRASTKKHARTRSNTTHTCPSAPANSVACLVESQVNRRLTTCCAQHHPVSVSETRISRASRRLVPSHESRWWLHGLHILAPRHTVETKPHLKVLARQGVNDGVVIVLFHDLVQDIPSSVGAQHPIQHGAFYARVRVLQERPSGNAKHCGLGEFDRGANTLAHSTTRAVSLRLGPPGPSTRWRNGFEPHIASPCSSVPPCPPSSGNSIATSATAAWYEAEACRPFCSIDVPNTARRLNSFSRLALAGSLSPHKASHAATAFCRCSTSAMIGDARDPPTAVLGGKPGLTGEEVEVEVEEDGEGDCS